MGILLEQAPRARVEGVERDLTGSCLLSRPALLDAYPGRNYPSVGYGTYRLIIRTSGKDRNYALKTPEIFTEYRLWINGGLVDQHGTIAGRRSGSSSLPSIRFHGFKGC
jgi:hypothetical protein